MELKERLAKEQAKEQAEVKELIAQIQALDGKRQELLQAVLEKQGGIKMLQKLAAEQDDNK